jgi:SAM-dependent methyltransferase
MTHEEWLATPLGRRCLANEQRLMRHVLDRVFGEQLLQIGAWGPPDAFVRYARTQRAALAVVDLPRDAARHVGADVVMDPGQLGIASDSVDAVILPHTLERTASPHALIREAGRILRADGHFVALGFDPNGPWGLRHLLAREGYPAGSRKLYREGQLRDWLKLLSFDVEPAIAYCHTLPFEQFRQLGTYPRERWAQKWLPLLAGGYVLFAQKRTIRLTPIRPAWRRKRLRAVGGLVEPTARASRMRECE